MWIVNMRIWIVTIICCSVSCKVVQYNDNFVTSVDNNKIKHQESPSSAPCTNCRSNPSVSSMQTQEIDELNLFEETLDYVENRLDINRETTLLTQSGNEYDQSGAVDPPNAWCEPILQVVFFKDNEIPDPSYYYNPPCTRLKRCGGCCLEEKHSCQPKNITFRRFKVQKVFLNTIKDSEKLIEEHTSCQCGCRVKPDNCTERQEYDANECRCDCKETEEKQNCIDNELKSWDHNNCRCTCDPGAFRDCNTPLKFDENTCRCEPSTPD